MPEIDLVLLQRRDGLDLLSGHRGKLRTILDKRIWQHIHTEQNKAEHTRIAAHSFWETDQTSRT